MERKVVLAALTLAVLLLLSGCVGPNGLPTKLGQVVLSPRRQVQLADALFAQTEEALFMAFRLNQIPAEVLPALELARQFAHSALRDARACLISGTSPAKALARFYDAMQPLLKERARLERNLTDEG